MVTPASRWAIQKTVKESTQARAATRTRRCAPGRGDGPRRPVDWSSFGAVTFQAPGCFRARTIDSTSADRPDGCRAGPAPASMRPGGLRTAGARESDLAKARGSRVM
ncbi:hypothetical protein GCM10010361_75030 [Streptomyces olivaceiscleroticus]|uniref:Uncharacterized protein n=1 Tax=Streptomyces olivaceiscleroticus TaxID=68245 RepID=A0ABP3LDI9_9ACTN